MSKPAALPLPSALACGILSDGEKALFLKRRDAEDHERLGLPTIALYSGQDAVSKLAERFLEQTGIDGHVQNVVLQATHNAGSRKKKRVIPVLGFRVTAKNTQARPSAPFSGYAWLTLEAAAGHKLERNTEWIRSQRRQQKP